MILDQITIFSMNHDNSAKFLATFKNLQHSFIVLEEGAALISSE
jgi:hypothetical protein